ncbi:hypothetical protein C5C74_08305 [Rathayibacter sp. AY1E8]|nr:hypothetical protein C5C74_08305 [Rathayibacter sp. AY1E8]
MFRTMRGSYQLDCETDGLVGCQWHRQARDVDTYDDLLVVLIGLDRDAPARPSCLDECGGHRLPPLVRASA